MISFAPTLKPRFIKIKSKKDWVPRLIDKIECPICGLDEIKEHKTKWIGQCSSCGHIHCFLYLTPVQNILYQLRAKILNMFGGTGCVDEETEFFNGKEWKKISEYKKGDKVLQYNKDGTSELVEPSKYHKYKADGWWTFENRYLDMKLSKEHNVAFLNKNKELVKLNATELSLKHNLSGKGLRYEIPQGFIFDNKNKKTISDDKLRIMVAIAADAYLKKDKIYIKIKKERKQDRLRNLLLSENIEFDEKKWKDGYITFKFTNDGYSKFISDWVYDLNINDLNVVSHELILWDGSAISGRGKKSESFYTTYKREADAAQYVFSATGYKSKISHDNRKYIISGDYCYRVGKAKKINTTLRSANSNKFIWEESKGEEYKYCFTVPSGLLVLRRSNKIFITGNSGKTTASAMIIAEEMRNNPGVKVAAFAQTIEQLKQTGKEELDKMFFDSEWVTKNDNVWKHRNGSKITWYTSDSEQKIRGMNIGLAWLLESSGIPHEIFKQLMTRTRQDEMKKFKINEDGDKIFEYDEETKTYKVVVLLEKGMIINETNPTYEWPRDKALFKSHTILYTESVRGINKIASFVEPMEDPENPKNILNMISVMFASIDNPLMTNEYISSIRMTYDTEDEYNRDIYCDMSYTSGLIYGEYADKMFKPVIDISVDGKGTMWLESIDPGGAGEGNDESAYGLIKLTMPKKSNELPMIEVVDGYKKSGLSTAEEAVEIWKKRNQYGWDLSKNFKSVVDPHGVKAEKKTKSNIVKDLRIYDIYLNKDEVNPDVDWGIKRVKGFLKAGKLVFNNNEFGMQAKNEVSTYVWTKNKSRSTVTGKINVKPIERNNHIMDMLRFAVTVIPVRPSAMTVFDEVAGSYSIEDLQRKKYSANSLDMFAQQYEIKDDFQMQEENKEKERGGGIWVPEF